MELEFWQVLPRQPSSFNREKRKFLWDKLESVCPCIRPCVRLCTKYKFLAPLAIGQRAYVMVHCLSCVRPSVRNFFLKNLLLWKYLSDFDEISQKCSCYGPLQNLLKEFDSIENWLLWQQNWKKMKTLKIFLSETIRVRATKFGMWLYLMGLYQVSSNYSPGVKFDPTPGVTSFTWDSIGKILENSLYVAIRPWVTEFCM